MKTFYAIVIERNNKDINDYHIVTGTYTSKKAFRVYLHTRDLIVRSIYTKEQIEAKIAKDLEEE